MRRSRLVFAALLAATIGSSASAENRQQRVRFARGATSAVVRGEVRGYDYVDYLVGARAGQHLTADLTRISGPAYFLVRAPGSDENLFDGSTSGDHFETVLPAGGDYRLRVFLMRSAARRNERSAYLLSVAIH